MAVPYIVKISGVSKKPSLFQSHLLEVTMHTLEGNVVQWIKSADQAELWNLRQVTLSFNKHRMFSL